MSKPVWHICPNLHAMTDMGFNNGSRDPSEKYGLPHTNNAECYRLREGKKCNNKGRCLIAKFYDDKD
jgi:hypothetical protein